MTPIPPNRPLLPLLSTAFLLFPLPTLALPPTTQSPPSSIRNPQSELRNPTTRPTFHLSTVKDPLLPELSGLAPVRNHPHLLWAHNDGGSPPALLLVDPAAGKVLSSLPVQGAPNTDWEDLATDHQGNLYIADTGNNNLARREVYVHRLPEPPDPLTAKGPLKPTATWTLRYANAQPFDCEALFVHADYAYLIPKLRNLDAPTLHRFPLTRTDKPVTLEPLAPLPTLRAAPVTAATTSPDHKYLAILTILGPQLFPLPKNPAADLPTTRPLARPTFVSPLMESASFTPTGLLTATEPGDLYLFSWPLLQLDPNTQAPTTRPFNPTTPPSSQ